MGKWKGYHDVVHASAIPVADDADDTGLRASVLDSLADAVHIFVGGRALMQVPDTSA